MKYVNIDTSDAGRFFDALEAAARGGFRKELELFLEGLGVEFLRIVQDEIMRLKAVDTRLLLASFHKNSGPLYDGDGNYVGESLWKLSVGDCVLEVGSTVNYAAHVNYGHKQQPGRFIPGYWRGDRFVYDKEAEGGMVLKASVVKGKPYWENALQILDKMMPEFLDAKLQEWLDNYF